MDSSSQGALRVVTDQHVCFARICKSLMVDKSEENVERALSFLESNALSQASDYAIWFQRKPIDFKGPC